MEYSEDVALILSQKRLWGDTFNLPSYFEMVSQLITFLCFDAFHSVNRGSRIVPASILNWGLDS